MTPVRLSTFRSLRHALLPACAFLILALTGCAKKTVEAARDVTPEVNAYYQAHLDFFTFAKPADLPADLDWQDGHDVPEFSAPEAKRGGTLRGFIDDFPRTLRFIGPDANGSFRSYILDDNALTLIQRQPNTGQYYPALAKSWALSTDRRTMYFRLDPDARYSDGVPVTADDFLFAFYFFRATYINEPWYNNYYTENFTNVTRYDDHTLAVTWKEPKPDIYDRLGSLSPVPQHFYKELGPDFAQRYQWRLEPTTGPYTVLPEDIHKGTSIELTRVKNWWASDKPWFRHRFNFDRVRLDVIRDPDKAFEAFKRGDLDAAGLSLPKYWYDKLPDADPLVQSGYIQKVVFYNEIPRPTYGLYLNSARPLLDNRDIRTGINFATNFQLVIDQYFRGDYQRMQATADGYAVVPLPGIKSRPFSVDDALASFAKVGFTKRGPDGILVDDNGRRLSFTVTSGYAALKDVLSILKQEALKAGLEFNIEVLDGTTAWKKIQEKQHDIAFTAFNTGIEMYPRYWENFHSVNAHKPQTNNLTNLADPAIDALIKRYDRATSMDEIRDLAARLETKIREQAVFVPGFEMPFYRSGFWRWIKWPKGFNVRLSQGSMDQGLAWIDEDTKKETLDARAANKTFPPSITVHDQWKRKD